MDIAGWFTRQRKERGSRKFDLRSEFLRHLKDQRPKTNVLDGDHFEFGIYFLFQHSLNRHKGAGE
jgi:hypothetical protein